MELKIKTNWTPDIKKNNHLKRKSLHEDLQSKELVLVKSVQCRWVNLENGKED